ncbi:MAG: hypothetical protein OXI24_10755 [Candidatus Poribacteria bacterium]|nr:hypothetical protein [Candidatus Poribacteria bacterium]
MTTRDVEKDTTICRCRQGEVSALRCRQFVSGCCDAMRKAADVCRIFDSSMGVEKVSTVVRETVFYLMR